MNEKAYKQLERSVTALLKELKGQIGNEYRASDDPDAHGHKRHPSTNCPPTGTLLQLEMQGNYPTIQFVTARHMPRSEALQRAFGCFGSSIPPRHLLFMHDDGGAELWNYHISQQHCYHCGLPLFPDNWKACGIYDEQQPLCDSCYNSTLLTD